MCDLMIESFILILFETEKQMNILGSQKLFSLYIWI